MFPGRFPTGTPSATSKSPAGHAARMVRLSEPYEPRRLRFLELWRHEGWRIKVNGIRHGGERPDAALVEQAKALARKVLPAPAVTPTRYGVGFLGVHQGRGADFVFVDWWEDENELHHVVWHTRPGDRARLLPAGATSPTACVWDLRVQHFEREAWVETVLANPGGPDVETYLARRIQEDA